uniref:Uncharacterized protein n=1 Tax=Arundo donax TaxID=35708 RepID=A0A0A9DLI3_ARUDO
MAGCRNQCPAESTTTSMPGSSAAHRSSGWSRKSRLWFSPAPPGALAFSVPFTRNGDQNTDTVASCDGNAHRRNLRSSSPSPSPSPPPGRAPAGLGTRS